MPDNVTSTAPVTSAAPATPSSTATPATPSTPSTELKSSSTPTQTPAPSGDQAQLQNPRERHKLQVDGKELEVDIEELKRGYGLKQASQRRMDEAARIRQQADDFNRGIELAKTDPRAARKFLSERIPPEILTQMAEEMIYEQVEQHQMSPEQRHIRELEMEREEREEQDRLAQEQHEEQAYQADFNKHVESFNKNILEALQKTKSPVNEFTVNRVAQFMRENHAYKLGYNADQIAGLVDEEYGVEMKSYVTGLTGEQLIEKLGDTVANKIRKADLARIRARNGAPPPPQNPANVARPSSDAPSTSNEKIDIHEYRRRINERIKD